MIDIPQHNPEIQVSRIEQLVKDNPEIAGLQAYEYLRSDVAEQKQGFISDSLNILSLTYPELTQVNLISLEVPTKAALETLMPGEQNPKKTGIFESIAYRYGELSMLSAAQRMNDASLAETDRAEAREWFITTNEALYGKPDEHIFSALARKHVLPQLSKDVAELPVARSLQQELANLIGPVNDTEYKQYVPGQETLATIQELITERFESIYNHVDPDKTYTALEIVDAIHEALVKIGGTELGWRALIVARSSALAVSAHQKIVEIGENRADLLGNELRGKIMHEVGVHAGRSLNAEKAGWLSAQYGQDGYLDFEEALATALEDAYKGKFADHGVNYYLIAGFAYGQDNHEPRDMKETYEIMWRVNALKAQKDTTDLSEEQLSKSKNSAFTSCMRLFRGTTTVDPGVVYLKDLAYFKGQELAWSILGNVTNQDDIDVLLAGKLDLTKSDHIEIAQDIVATNKVS